MLPLPVYIVGIAVDGDSEVSTIKPIVLVKRSGKVIELEQEISGMNCAIFICSSDYFVKNLFMVDEMCVYVRCLEQSIFCSD